MARSERGGAGVLQAVAGGKGSWVRVLRCNKRLEAAYFLLAWIER